MILIIYKMLTTTLIQVRIFKNCTKQTRLEIMSCALKILRAQANRHAHSDQPSAQNLENILEKYTITYVEALRGWFFQAHKFDGKNLSRKQTLASGKQNNNIIIIIYLSLDYKK